MGGRIWAESTVGIGSTFHLALPFVVARRTAASDFEEDRDSLSTQWEGPVLQILLAEDNAINQKFAVTILERMGHQVTCTNNGKEALQLWKQGTFDLILMDIQMPLLNGSAATAAIRKEEEGTNSHVPIIALTAHALQEEKRQLLRSGFDGYVPKPMEVDTLTREMKKVLRQSEP